MKRKIIRLIAWTNVTIRFLDASRNARLSIIEYQMTKIHSYEEIIFNLEFEGIKRKLKIE